MQSKNLTISVLYVLLLTFVLLGCGGDEETPAEVIEPPLEAPALTSQEIADIALRSTVLLSGDHHDWKKGKWRRSGFIIDHGHILTVDDVGSYGEYVDGTVELISDQKQYDAWVYGEDEILDMSIIEVEDLNAPALPLGDSDTVQIGDTVYVAGNSKKQKGIFSTGIIGAVLPAADILSTKHPTIGIGPGYDKWSLIFPDNDISQVKVFQITTPILETGRGGPVLNTKGEVIGMATTISVDGTIGNYAIPINYVKELQEAWLNRHANPQ